MCPHKFLQHYYYYRIEIKLNKQHKDEGNRKVRQFIFISDASIVKKKMISWYLVCLIWAKIHFFKYLRLN